MIWVRYIYAAPYALHAAPYAPVQSVIILVHPYDASSWRVVFSQTIVLVQFEYTKHENKNLNSDLFEFRKYTGDKKSLANFDTLSTAPHLISCKFLYIFYLQEKAYETSESGFIRFSITKSSQTTETVEKSIDLIFGASKKTRTNLWISMMVIRNLWF